VPVAIGAGTRVSVSTGEYCTRIGERASRGNDEEAGSWRKGPDLRVEPILMQDRPAHALAQSTGDAQLVVVGSRGRGGLTGMLLGSVSQAMLQHAECSVAVVR